MRLAITIALSALVAAAAPAAAQSPPQPVVVAVDKAEVLVDLGGRHGVGAGAVLDLMHEVVVKDPVSGETLRDRFVIGQLTVTRAGDAICAASAPAELLPRIRPGNPVALVSRPVTFRDPWQARLAERGAATERDLEPGDPRARGRAEARVADAEATRAVWLATLGKPPAERVVRWQELLAARPGSAYRDAIEAEIGSLRRQMDEAERSAEQRASHERRDDLRARRLAAVDGQLDPGEPLFGRAPDRVVAGRDLVLAFALRDPAALGGGWLYVRAAGDDRFARVALSRSGDAYLRARVPLEAMRPPALEYFVELADGDGEPRPVLGSQELPRRIAVDPAALEPPPQLRDRSRVTLMAEYVDFDGGRSDGFDQYYQVEADFMYRFLQPVYAVRLGFGTLSGQGGPKDVIDDARDRGDGDCRDAGGAFRCASVTYSYIYAELEHRFSDVVALMVRPQAGQLTTNTRLGGGRDRCLGSDVGSDCDFDRGLGLRLRVRLGEETGTNLAIGVGATAGIGTLFEAAYAWNAYAALPVTIAVQVTDQPVTSDFGVRLIGDLGWRSLGWVYPSLRLSYQARDVDHQGVSGGLGVNFDW
jgi:hypothetical protein